MNANVVRIVNGAEASSYTDALVFLTPNTTEVDAGGSQTTRGLALFPTTGSGAIDASSSFAAAVGRQNFITDGFTHRWVVVNDGAYYVSDAAVAGWNPFINRTIDGLTALALADPAGATWYPWSPTRHCSTPFQHQPGRLGFRPDPVHPHGG